MGRRRKGGGRARRGRNWEGKGTLKTLCYLEGLHSWPVRPLQRIPEPHPTPLWIPVPHHTMALLYPTAYWIPTSCLTVDPCTPSHSGSYPARVSQSHLPCHIPFSLMPSTTPFPDSAEPSTSSVLFEATGKTPAQGLLPT